MKTAASSPAVEFTGVLLNLFDPAAVSWEMQQVQLDITRRAYELFQIRGREHGHDWEDWFRADSELLRPVSVAIAASLDRISVRANVLGFQENELKVAIEPQRILIMGRRVPQRDRNENDAPALAQGCPDQIMRAIDLPAQVLPEAAVVELHSGLLKFELPRSAPLGAPKAGV
jgi:HSP20 family molecular chaperone IbpA